MRGGRLIRLGLLVIAGPLLVPALSWPWLMLTAPGCQGGSLAEIGLIGIMAMGVGVVAWSVGGLTRSRAHATIAAIGATALVVPLEGVAMLLYIPAAGCPT